MTLTKHSVGLGALALCLSLPTGLPASAAPAQPAAYAATGPAATHADVATPRTPTPAEPNGAGVGRWTVHRVAKDTYRVRWSSPQALPVTDARPLIERGGKLFAVPTVVPGGRRVQITLTQATRPTTSDLDVVLSDRVLDETATAAPTPQQVVAPLPGSTSLTPDPGTPGAHPVTTSTYRLPGVKLPGMPAKIEMLGYVVRPTDATQNAPVVLFLHGRHDACYRNPHPVGHGNAEWPCPKHTSPVPSYLGYDYIQQLLASQGYVTVSISANGINAQDWRLLDAGAAARAGLVRRHLAALADPANAGTIGPAVTADLGNVVLVGHSRGGEGAARASTVTGLSAPYRITGQILIGPTDFGRQTTPYTPTVTLLPYCDGDVSDLQGQAYTDVARGQQPDDTALHSSLLVMGANHNYFNTEWTPGRSVAPSQDDWYGDPNATCGKNSPTRLSKAEQRAVGASYVAGAVRLMANDDDAMLPLFDGSRVSLASANDTDVRSHAVGLERTYRAPGHGAVLAPGATARTQLCVGRADERRGTQFCGRGSSSVRTPHWPGTYPPGLPTRRAFEMAWTAAGQTGGLAFVAPLDITGRTLHLRTIADPARPTAQLSVTVHDAGGHSSTVPLPDLPPLPTGDYVLGKKWGQDLTVDSALFDPGVDLSQIVEVDLVADNPKGRVWVLEVAAGDQTLPPVPHRRSPTVELDDVRITEGNARGIHFAAVPFHLTGDVSTPSKFTALSQNYSTYRFGKPINVTVPAGQRTGSIQIPYRANRRDDLARRVIAVSAFATSGAMPTNYLAKVTILDDDPTPAVGVRALRSTIREGWTARWTVTLARPVRYYTAAIATVRRGPTRTDGLRARDVSRRWVHDHLIKRVEPGNRLLARLPLRLIKELTPGERTVTFSVPTRVDQLLEGREHLTLRVRVLRLGAPVTVTIGVLDRRSR